MANKQVAHVWANQNKERMRGSNFFFEGPAIYSYGRHFCIAKFVQNTRGEVAVLINGDSYSVSTSRHTQFVRRALDGLDVPTFTLSAVGAAGNSEDYEVSKGQRYTVPSRSYLLAEYENMIKSAAQSLVKSKRARKNASWYIEDAQRAQAEAQRLNEFFALNMEADSEKMRALIADIEEQARENAAAMKEARAREKERQVKQREKDREDFEAWKRGQLHSCPFSFQTDENGSAYLRIQTLRDTVNTDITWQVVQTSRGAEVPFEDARKAFRFVKLCRMTGRAFQANGSQVPVGHFAIRFVTAEGNVQVGCHFFTWERVEEFAKSCGIFEDAATEEALTQTANH